MHSMLIRDRNFGEGDDFGRFRSVSVAEMVAMIVQLVSIQDCGP